MISALRSRTPAKLAQKDRDARWTVKWSKAKPAADGSPRVDLAVPAFGYKNHVAHRPAPRIDPDLDGDGRRPSRRSATTEPRDASEHRERRLGGHGLPLEGERAAPCPARLRLTHSSQEAAGSAHAGQRRPRERRQVEGPQRRRARIWPPERASGPGRANHRPCPSDREDRPRQPCLQHAPRRLAHPTTAHASLSRRRSARTRSSKR